MLKAAKVCVASFNFFYVCLIVLYCCLTPPFRKEAPVVVSKTYPVKKRLLPRPPETRPDAATDCCTHSQRLPAAFPQTAANNSKDCQKHPQQLPVIVSETADSRRRQQIIPQTPAVKPRDCWRQSKIIAAEHSQRLRQTAANTPKDNPRDCSRDCSRDSSRKQKQQAAVEEESNLCIFPCPMS